MIETPQHVRLSTRFDSHARTHARSLARKSRHVDGVTGQRDFSLHGQLRATIDHVHDHSSARVLRRNYSDTRRYDLMFR